jgi:hypothetical protein
MRCSPLLFCACRLLVFGALVIAARAGEAKISPENSSSLEERALRVMADIVPVELEAGTFAKVTFEGNQARWGRIFGDQEVAALVAISEKKSPANSSENAELCLLLWQDGWQFVQHVGKVSGSIGYDGQPDWVLKTGSSPRAIYLVSKLELYPSGEHASWLCDPQRHRLIPTGWRTDAIPSISGNTITFTSQKNPGYTPIIREVCRFDGKPSAPIVTITQEDDTAHNSAPVVTVHGSKADETVTWKVWKKSRDYNHRNEVYALSRTKGEKTAGPPKEDVTVTFDWEGSDYPYSPTAFLLWRLTGLDRNALEGVWNQDESRTVVMPRSAKVTGSPQDVQRFGWPSQ